MTYPAPDYQQSIPPQPPAPPKRKMPLWQKGLIGLAGVVLIGTAAQSCSQGVEDGMNGNTPEPPPISTPEPTAEPTPQEATTAPEPEPTTDSFDPGDYDTTIMLMEMTWAATTEEDQENICWGVNNMGSDWVLENFDTENEFNEEAIIDFFDEVC